MIALFGETEFDNIYTPAKIFHLQPADASFSCSQ